MSNLTIRVKNTSSLKPAIFVNNKQVKLKKENGLLVAKVDSISLCHLKITNYHPLLYPFGMLINYFFFLISFLGILDKHYKNKAMRVLFEANIDAKSTTEVDIKYLPFQMDKPFVEFIINQPAEILDNRCFIDLTLQRKIRVLFFLKILTWVLSILAVLMYAVTQIF